MVTYDPKIIQTFAYKLYSRACRALFEEKNVSHGSRAGRHFFLFLLFVHYLTFV